MMREKNFNRLKSSLKVIEKNIDKYFPDEKSIESKITKAMKPKIFISHSSKDVKYVEPMGGFWGGVGGEKTFFFFFFYL